MEVNLTLALVPAFLGTATGIVIPYVIFIKSIHERYPQKTRRSSAQRIMYVSWILAFVVISNGMITIANELFLSAFNNIAINSNKVFSGLLVGVIPPIVIAALGKLLASLAGGTTSKSELQKLDESIANHYRGNSSQEKLSTFPPNAGQQANIGNINLKKGISPKSQDDNSIWEAALNEYESSERDRALYAKLLAQHDGNENQIKANYIKLKVQTWSTYEKPQKASKPSTNMFGEYDYDVKVVTAPYEKLEGTAFQNLLRKLGAPAWVESALIIVLAGAVFYFLFNALNFFR